METPWDAPLKNVIAVTRNDAQKGAWKRLTGEVCDGLHDVTRNDAQKGAWKLQVRGMVDEAPLEVTRNDAQKGAWKPHRVPGTRRTWYG